MSASVAPQVGSVLGGRYELVRHIARGGMGEVFEGRDQVLDRRVAVKLLRAGSHLDRSRFDAEAKVLARLSHPGLVQVHDAGAHGDDAYVVLELVDGLPLAARLHRGRPRPAEQVRIVGESIADALAHIHEQGVVHRDVSPSNIICPPEGPARLVDFGIARLVESAHLTATATTIGTAAFMAPEQVQGLEVTPAADVYALGLVLLEALTGRREFDGPLQEVAVARLARDPDTTHGVPGPWRGLLHDMVQRDPEARPTAAVVRERLAQLVQPDEATAPMGTAPAMALAGADGIEATRAMVAPATEVLPLAPVEAPRPWARRLPGGLPLWAALGGLAAALLLVVVALGQSSGTSLSPTTTTPSSVAVVADVTTPPTSAPTTTVAVPAAPAPAAHAPHGKAKKPKGAG